MKEHLKKLRPLLLLMALFMLSNCQEDLYHIETSDKHQIDAKISAHTGEFALEQKKIVLDILKENGGIANNKLRQHLVGNLESYRTLKDIEPFIDDSEVLVATAPNGVKTYTCNLLNPANPDNVYENLVIQSNKDGRKIMVLTYTLEPEFAKAYALNGNLENFTGTVAFDLLSVSASYPCIEVPGHGNGNGNAVPVYGGAPGAGITDPKEPFNPEGQTYQQLMDAKFLAMKFRNISVTIVSGPIEQTSGPGAPTTPVAPPAAYRTAIISSFGLHNPANPCAEDEVIPVTLGGGGAGNEESHEDNCNDLKKLAVNPGLINALTDLKTKTYDSVEHGYAVKKDTNNSLSVESALNSNNIPSQIDVTQYIGGQNIGVFHTHPDPFTGHYPMFSASDILYLYYVAARHSNNGQPKNYNDYVITLTTIHGTYALKFNDFTKASGFVNSALFKEMDKILFNSYQKRSPEDNPEDFMIDLLNIMKQYNFGVSLFEADEDLNWSEVELNKDPLTSSTPLKSIPCN